MSGPNVLLVVLDSVRARNVGLYGHHRATTPFLSSYADRATVYSQAHAPGIHSVASHASIWTGAHVDEHMMIQHEDRLRPSTTVWESLSDEGYDTGLFTTNTVVAHASNLAEFFDETVSQEYVETKEKLFPEAHGPSDVVKHEGVVGNIRRSIRDEHPYKSLLNNVHHFYKQTQSDQSKSVTSADLVDEFISWQAGADGSWAACLNLMDAHFPYAPALEYDQWGGERLRMLHDDLDRPPVNEFIGGRPWWQLEAFESLYDGSILELDSLLERLISSLKRAGVHGNTFVVITSDHGEGFGEVSALTGRTRLVAHAWGIGEELTHVPLVVKYPEQSGGETVEAPATLTRFRDSVAAVLDSTAEHDSFVPEGPVIVSTYRLREEDDLIFEGSEEHAEDYYGPWRAVYRQEGDTVYKYAHRNSEAVTIRIQDAQYRSPISWENTGEVEAAFADVASKKLKETTQNELSSEVEDQLTELGYLR